MTELRELGEKKEKRIRRIKFVKFDFPLFITLLILVGFGLVMIFSASYYSAENSKYADGLYYFKKQLIGIVLGMAAMIFLMFFDYKRLLKLRWIIMGVALLMLVAVLIPGIGQNLNGSRRWINVGISIQPSEVMKFALIIFIAGGIATSKHDIRNFFTGLLPYLVLLGVICVLIYLQPNFSAIICLAALTFIMLFAGGAHIGQMAVLCGIAVVAACVFVFGEDYRVDRLMAFQDPWKYTGDESYQLIQSLYAIGSGGIFGMGLGNGMQKLLFLPYSESDFIFSIVAEELGFVGAVLLIVLFAIFIWRGIRIAMKAPDMFGFLIAVGVVSIIGIQVMINIGVVTGAIPATGVALPFISAGSSSLMIFMAMTGVLLNISRQSNKA